jgi:solute carrier family 25 (mitochondrial carnitine/acylcarnitine transporter), member 20/29
MVKENKKSAAKAMGLNSIAGSVAGVAGVLIGQPFDIVKVRIQNQSPLNKMYTSAIQCARFIAQHEGKLVFYKGTMAPLAGISVCTSTQFALNEFSKKTMMDLNKARGLVDPFKLSPIQYMC